jgi:hypothetical protein
MKEGHRAFKNLLDSPTRLGILQMRYHGGLSGNRRLGSLNVCAVAW